jgi:hypothetical protein
MFMLMKWLRQATSAIPFEVLGDMHYMAVWLEDFSKRSMEELLRSVIENRAWSKELRLSSGVLVNSRLAKQIGADEYAATRRLTNESVAECNRRRIILMNAIRAQESEGKMNTTISKYCDVCKADTKRCQYYPQGRSRQHDLCLECDRKDRRNSEAFPSSDARYCIECDRNQSRLIGAASHKAALFNHR